MILSISGVSPRIAKELDKACRYFALQLMHSRTVRNLNIDIEVIRTLDCEGYVVCEDEHKNPRNFLVQLRRLPEDEMIKTLAHEMVHVKQYAKNELAKRPATARGGGSGIVTRWLGETWKPKRTEHKYYDCPWEIEAYGREVGLWAKWLDHNGTLLNKDIMK